MKIHIKHINSNNLSLWNTICFMFIKLVFLQVTKFGKLSITVINSTFKFLLFNLAFVCNLEIKMKNKSLHIIIHTMILPCTIVFHVSPCWINLRKPFRKKYKVLELFWDCLDL